MPVERTRAVIEQELRGVPIEEVFEWIDLDNVLGSASIAQVPLSRPRTATLYQITACTTKNCLLIIALCFRRE